MTTNKELEEKGFSDEERRVYWELQFNEKVKQKTSDNNV